MNTTRIMPLVAVSAALLFSACTATPEGRIKANPQTFAQLTPDQQALVRAGEIAPGFDMNAVLLALGEPDRKYLEIDASGRHEIWHYTTYEDDEGVVIVAGYYHHYHGWGGPYFWGGPPYPYRVHDRIRVVFDNAGRVASIQQEKT